MPCSAGIPLEQVGGYPDVETFLSVHRRPCHVVVLDLCLNRRTGDSTLLQGVRAIRHLAGDLGHRVLVYTAGARPEPVHGVSLPERSATSASTTTTPLPWLIW